MHEASFCKSKKSRIDSDSASNFVGLEKSVTCHNSTRKCATVKNRRVHELRYCGRAKAGRSQFLTCKVHDRGGADFENLEAFEYLGSFVSLKGDQCQVGGRETALCEFSEALKEQTTRYSPQTQITQSSSVVSCLI